MGTIQIMYGRCLPRGGSGEIPATLLLTASPFSQLWLASGCFPREHPLKQNSNWSWPAPPQPWYNSRFVCVMLAKAPYRCCVPILLYAWWGSLFTPSLVWRRLLWQRSNMLKRSCVFWLFLPIPNMGLHTCYGLGAHPRGFIIESWHQDGAVSPMIPFRDMRQCCTVESL